MAKYLVTGGCGFIGSHLCDALGTAGHSVRILDDLSTGKRENVPDVCLAISTAASRSARMMLPITNCSFFAALASNRATISSHASKSIFCRPDRQARVALRGAVKSQGRRFQSPSSSA